MPALAARSIDALLADDPRALDRLELRGNLLAFAEARSRLDAAEAATIAEFDEHCYCIADGAANMRAWLAHYTGESRKVAGARVLMATRLRRMPLMAGALQAGRVTASHVRAMGEQLSRRTADAFVRDEALLVEKATELEADDFGKLAVQWKHTVDDDGPEPPAPEPSEMNVSTTYGGRLKTDADFDVEDGIEYRAELEAIYDELWHEDEAAPEDDPLKHRTVRQRYAAAQLEMARRSRTIRSAGEDAEDLPPPPSNKQIIAVVDYDAVEDRYANAELDDGTPVPIDVLERWACDSAIGRVVMKGASAIIDLGDSARFPSAAQRRALYARDRRCIVPGCRRRARWCEAHHVIPWPHGPTNLSNLVLLCNRHHKHVHAGVIQLLRDDSKDAWQVVRRDGTPLVERPPPRLVA